MGTKKPQFKNFSAQTRSFLQAVYSEYEISDSAGLKLLEVAGACLDRLTQAQEILKRDGVTIADRNGNQKMHPACIIEKDARAHFLQTMKELHLDLEPLKAIGRPPGRSM